MESRHGADVGDQRDEAEELVPHEDLGGGTGAELEEYVAPSASAPEGGGSTPQPTGSQTPEAAAHGSPRDSPSKPESVSSGSVNVESVHALRSQEGRPFELSSSRPAAEYGLGGVW